MGIIRAIKQTVGGTLADQWLEVIEPENMGGQTVLTAGVRTGKGANRKGGKDTISNGSVIHVYEGQFMMLLDGGRIVDYSAEPGYFTVDNSSMPSMFSGSLDDVVKNSFDRFRFGGATPTSQKVLYLNLQEIKGIKFGTRTPINYFDNFYNAELFLRAHGNYSIKITNPLQFYAEVIPRNKDRVNYDEIGEQYLSEFLEALQSAINQMSADGTRISYVTSKAMELGKYMQDILDADWNQMRGMEIQKVGIAGISYDEESQKLINMRNEGAMLGSDFNVMRGMAVKNITEGVRDAGSNANGAMAGFMGVGMGMNAMNQTLSGLGAMQTPADMQANAGMQQGSAAPAGQMPAAGAVPAGQTPGAGTQAGWTCECGHVNTGKFCSECGKPMPVSDEWTCECGHVNTGKFCSECGKPKPVSGEWTCECGQTNTGKFCSNCGKARN